MAILNSGSDEPIICALCGMEVRWAVVVAPVVVAMGVLAGVVPMGVMGEASILRHTLNGDAGRVARETVVVQETLVYTIGIRNYPVS